jgi:hypothetical protein
MGAIPELCRDVQIDKKLAFNLSKTTAIYSGVLMVPLLSMGCLVLTTWK